MMNDRIDTWQVQFYHTTTTKSNNNPNDISFESINFIQRAVFTKVQENSIDGQLDGMWRQRETTLFLYVDRNMNG